MLISELVHMKKGLEILGSYEDCGKGHLPKLERSLSPHKIDSSIIDVSGVRPVLHEKHSFLVVDDNDMCRNTLARLIKWKNCAVYEASSGESVI